MKCTFVESRAFSAWIRDLLDDETYRLFQQELLANPEKGDVSADEKKVMRELADVMRAEALAHHRRKNRGQ